jgi:hypothetical protein
MIDMGKTNPMGMTDKEYIAYLTEHLDFWKEETQKWQDMYFELKEHA